MRYGEDTDVRACLEIDDVIRKTRHRTTANRQVDRHPVGDILGYLAGGMSEDQILADFPQLTREDIRACLAYAAERERRTQSVPAA